VDQNYDVHLTACGFCCAGSNVRQLIKKGPKHGCLFYLQLPIPQSLPYFSILSLSSKVLSNMLKFGLLNNKEYSSSIVFSNCATCKLGKSKT
jgi:hypothetical protein